MSLSYCCYNVYKVFFLLVTSFILLNLRHFGYFYSSICYIVYFIFTYLYLYLPVLTVNHQPY